MIFKKILFIRLVPIKMKTVLISRKVELYTSLYSFYINLIRFKFLLSSFSALKDIKQPFFILFRYLLIHLKNSDDYNSKCIEYVFKFESINSKKQACLQNILAHKHRKNWRSFWMLKYQFNIKTIDFKFLINPHTPDRFFPSHARCPL